MLQRFPVIVGPTASGKSALAIQLATRLHHLGFPPGEIVSADSMQVYRHMDIGTAKPTSQERHAVPHHLIDLVEPTDSFSVDQWKRLAEAAIHDIQHRGRTPIVVGGTMLYVRALIEGLFDGPAGDPALRASLEALPRDELRARLERVDPAAAQRIHTNDLRRTIRALEVQTLTGAPISQLQKQWDSGSPRSNAWLIGLRWETPALNTRINVRVRAMVERGLVQEARNLWEAGRLGPQAREALGYKQLIRHFQGHNTLNDALEQVKIETRRMGKNQRTWLRRLGMTEGFLWIDGGHPSPVQVIQRFIQNGFR